MPKRQDNQRQSDSPAAVQSVDRALQVLDILAELGNAGVTEIAAELGVHKSTVSRLVAVLEARARLESAKMLADAEVVRAEGAARANRILQDSLGGPDGYLRYLQIQAIDAKDASIIYVPTESGLPLLESSRLAPRTNAAN